MADVNLRTLVLSDQYIPLEVFPHLSTISVKEAIQQYMSDDSTVLHFYDRPVLSGFNPIIHPEKGMLFWPSVIVQKKTGKKAKKVRATKHNLFLRDHCQCGYCGKALTIDTTTKDHFIPVSKGGKDTWENLVAACSACNLRKGNELPGKKWTPKFAPYEPTFHQLLEARKKHPLVVDDEAWIPFLPVWSSDVIVRPKAKDENVIKMAI